MLGYQPRYRYLEAIRESVFALVQNKVIEV